MAKLYVVDRYNRYQENQIISLKKFYDITPIELSNLVTELFPDGVSDQGNYYFLSNVPYIDQTINIDWSFEFYRLAKYPTKPSRWQSLYAWQSLNEAIAFRSSNGSPENPIYELDVDLSRCHIADMRLLDNSSSALVHTYRVKLYWQGQTMPAHIVPDWPTNWEVLVPLSTTIGKRIY